MGAPKKKKCRNGHALNSRTCYVKSNGGRECKKCSAARNKERRLRLKMEGK